MFHKILVCLDRSACTLAAARAGAAIARHSGAEIVALNVFHHSFAGPAEIGAWAIAIDQNVIDRCAREELEAVTRNTGPIFAELDTPPRVIQEIGHPVDVILRVAEKEKVDLIVVGSRGLRGVKELYLGSVSSAVMHHARCPVLIARGDYVPAGTADFQEIVLASDGSACSRNATQVAINMARKFGTSLTVLNVCTDLSSTILPEEEEVLIGDLSPDLYASHMLEFVRLNVSEPANEAGVYCSYVQKSGHPCDAIVRYAEEHHPDLIVVGSRGLGGFEQMLVGSVSNYVEHHVTCPVLVVR